MWVEFVGSLLLSERFSLGFYVFSPSIPVFHGYSGFPWALRFSPITKNVNLIREPQQSLLIYLLENILRFKNVFLFYSPTPSLDEMEQVPKFPSIVDLNVGGCLYTTSLDSLTRYPNSMLGIMFSGRRWIAKDSRGRFFIDRDGPMFRYVLNFLRSSKLNLPDNFQEFDQLMEEADFYQISQLIESLKEIKSAKSLAGNQIIRLSLDRDKHGLETLLTIYAEKCIVQEIFRGLDCISNPVVFSFNKEQADSSTTAILQELTNHGFQVMTSLSHPGDQSINEWFFIRKR